MNPNLVFLFIIPFAIIGAYINVEIISRKGHYWHMFSFFITILLGISFVIHFTFNSSGDSLLDQYNKPIKLVKTKVLVTEEKTIYVDANNSIDN